ncbi:MAG: ferredoxin [Pseudomonadota bacterium]|nr:ferredoxin [Pseudomonadota bacterium]
MSIKRVWIDKENCICCGLAEGTCPEVFKIVDSNTVIEGVDYSSFEKKIKEAADECPVQAVKFE